jgi:hypothetical protein
MHRLSSVHRIHFRLNLCYSAVKTSASLKNASVFDTSSCWFGISKLIKIIQSEKLKNCVKQTSVMRDYGLMKPSKLESNMEYQILECLLF